MLNTRGYEHESIHYFKSVLISVQSVSQKSLEKDTYNSGKLIFESSPIAGGR